MKEWVGKHYNTIQKPGLEGDDCLGLLATRPGNECIVVSSDKDLKTIPGKLYRPDDDEVLEISLEEADRFFLTQTLTGDVTDGYKGCPGVGPKTAEKILGPRPHWGAVEQAYIKAGLTKEDAHSKHVLQGSCDGLTGMWRKESHDFGNHKTRRIHEADARRSTAEHGHRPPHYNTAEIECIDAIRAATGDGFHYHLQGLKTCGDTATKASHGDLKKARWYLDRLIEITTCQAP